MRVLLSAVILAALMIPAYGQARKQPMSDDRKPQDAAKAGVDDKGYKSALERMPPGKYDPWRDVRDPGKPVPPTK